MCCACGSLALAPLPLLLLLLLPAPLFEVVSRLRADAPGMRGVSVSEPCDTYGTGTSG